MRRHILSEADLLLIVDDNNIIRTGALAAQGYRYAWIQRIGSVYIGEIAGDVEIGDLIEARFFNKDKEMHFFFDGGKLCVVEVCYKNGESEEGGHVADCIIEEEQLLRERYGKKVVIRSYIDYDGDGQAYVAYSALADYEGR